MVNNHKNELDTYLHGDMNKRQRKILAEIQKYQELRIKFPCHIIPFEAVNSPEPEQFVIAYNKRDGSIPHYWKTNSVKKLYQDEYTIPYLFTKYNLEGVRDALYTEERSKKNNSEPAVLYLDPQILYDYCCNFKVNYVTECFYDGTDSYFLKTCKAGILSNGLMKALGTDDNNYIVNLNKDECSYRKSYKKM